MVDEAVTPRQAPARTLPAMREDSGREMLALADRLNIGALGCGWTHTVATDQWWFFLVTPLIDEKGPIWMYERLSKVFKAVKLPEGITPLNIRIISPREEFYKKFRFYNSVKPSPNVQVAGLLMELSGNLLPPGWPVDRLWFYRMQRPPEAVADVAKRFDRRVKELLAA